jgi:hypothetical protein
VEAPQVADPAARRDPADPHRPGVTEPDREPLLRDGLRDLARSEARLCPRGLRLRVDVEGLHRAQIEHDPAIGRAVTRGAVPAAAHRELQPGLAGRLDDPPHVLDVLRLHDHRGPAVDVPGHHLACRVVALVIRADDAAVDLLTQAGEVKGGAKTIGGDGHWILPGFLHLPRDRACWQRCPSPSANSTRFRGAWA